MSNLVQRILVRRGDPSDHLRCSFRESMESRVGELLPSPEGHVCNEILDQERSQGRV